MRWLAGCLSLLLGLVPGGAAGNILTDAALNGVLKSYNLYSEKLSQKEDGGVFSLNTARLDVDAVLFDDYLLEFSLEQQLLWSSRRDAPSLNLFYPNRRFDLEDSWGTEQQFSGLLQVDRMSLQGESLGWRWTLGRQAIGFGRISLFSPLDVIAPFPPDVIDADVRPGVDAARMVRYFGLAGQVGGTLVFGDDSDRDSYLLTFSEHFIGTDLLLIGGQLRGRDMAGVGLAGEIGNVGLKGELTYYRGKDVAASDGDLYGDFYIAAVELWYRFDSGLVVIAEYLYNGSGGGEPEEYPLVLASAPYREGLSFLVGRNYLLVGPSYQLHPLITLNGLIISNLDDDSLLVRPQLSLSLSDNLQLDLFWGWGMGEATETDPLTGFPVVRSEFGASGDGGGCLLRWYF